MRAIPIEGLLGRVAADVLIHFFNLVGAMTGQSILLVGMMTEAVVTPWLAFIAMVGLSISAVSADISVALGGSPAVAGSAQLALSRPARTEASV